MNENCWGKLGQAHKIEIFRLGAGLPVKCILRRGSANFFFAHLKKSVLGSALFHCIFGLWCDTKDKKIRMSRLIIIYRVFLFFSPVACRVTFWLFYGESFSQKSATGECTVHMASSASRRWRDMKMLKNFNNFSVNRNARLTNISRR